MFKKQCLALLVILSVFAATAGAVPADRTAEYGLYGFENKSVAKKLENAVVMRAYNNYAYVFGIRENIDYGSEYIAPYKADDTMYVPLSFVITSFGGTSAEEDGTAATEYNGKKMIFKEAEITEGFESTAQLYEKRLCVPAAELAEAMSLELLEFNDVTVFSKEKIELEKSERTEVENTLAYTWRNVNLAGQGFITNVIQNPLDGMLYCVTDVGGAYRYEPESKMWIQLFDWLDSKHQGYENVCGVGFDPVDENVIYMACFTELLKSNDKGKTWSKANLRKNWSAGTKQRYSGENIIIDPNNRDVIYVGTDFDGLWKSEDRAENWTKVDTVPYSAVNPDEVGVRTLWFDEKSEVVNGKTSVIYAGSNGHGLYKSDNGGESFAPVPGSPKYIRRWENYKGGWLVTTDEGLFIFKDDKWENISPSIANTTDYCAVTVHPNNSNVMVICTEPFTPTTAWGAFFTVDGGKKWMRVPDTKLPYGSWWSDCIFDPYEPEDLIYMTGAGAFKLCNIFEGDENKVYSEQFSYGIEELCMNTLLTLPKKEENQPILLEGYMDYGGAWHGEDYTLPHTVQQNAYAEGLGMDYCASDPSIVVKGSTMGTSDESAGYISISTDYGRTFKLSPAWKQEYNPQNLAVSATKQENGKPVIIVFTSYTNKLFRSADLGESWEELDVPDFWTGKEPTNFWARSMQVVCADRVKGNVFYLRDNQNFLSSDDFGKTWKIMSKMSGDVTWAMETMYGSPGEVWACHKGSLKYTRDGGKSWQSVPGFGASYGVTFGKNKSTEAYPCIYTFAEYNGSEGVYRSDDRGKTWVKISYGMDFPTIAQMKGDMNIYGRVFVAKESLGVRCGDFAQTDTRKPVITVNQKSTSAEKGADYAVSEKSFTVSGSVSKDCEIRINNIPQPYSSSGLFSMTLELAKGDNSVIVEAADRNGNRAEPVIMNVHYDPDYVGFDLECAEYTKTNSKDITLKGRTNRKCTVYVNGAEYATDENLNFSIPETLADGENIFKISAYDGKNYSEEKTVEFVYDKTPPNVETEPFETTVKENYMILKASADEDGILRVNRITKSVKAGEKVSMFLALTGGENKITVQAKDGIGNVSKPLEYTVVSTYSGESGYDLNVAYAKDFEFTGDPEKDFGELPYTMTKLMEKTTTNICTFGLRWDETNLYVGVKVIDDILCDDSDANYQRDAIEVYLDGGHERAEKYDANDLQMIFPWNGEPVPGTTVKQVTHDYGYTMEIAIPWSIVNQAGKPGKKVGFDIDCCDNNGNGGRDGVIGFAGTENNYCDTSNYATLTLIGEEN